MKVIIADDSELMRQRIKELILQFSECELVGETGNGLCALNLINKHMPDLAIIDIRMPGMDGISLLKKIREMRLNISTCILTGYPYPLYKRKCMDAGVDHFLSKSEDFTELESILSNMVNDISVTTGDSVIKRTL